MTSRFVIAITLFLAGCQTTDSDLSDSGVDVVNCAPYSYTPIDCNYTYQLYPYGPEERWMLRSCCFWETEEMWEEEWCRWLDRCDWEFIVGYSEVR